GVRRGGRGVRAAVLGVSPRRGLGRTGRPGPEARGRSERGGVVPPCCRGAAGLPVLVREEVTSVASKFAWLVGKRGLILAVASVVAAVLGAAHGNPHSCYGFWDQP